MRKTLTPVALCLFAALPAAQAADAYRHFSTVQEEARALAKQFPKRVSLETFGQSSGGKPLLWLRIAGEGSVAPDQRPAVFVGGNVVGFHHAGTEAAMDLAQALAEGKDEKIQAILKSRTVYIAPVLNPDAHDAMFGKLRQLRTGVDGKLDRDLDGLFGEDGANDLNGDGIISQMRVRDARGDMVVDAEDPRRMVEADASKGQRGEYRVMVEGDDDDADGVFNEDASTGLSLDRNFPAGFAVAVPDNGAWPGVAPETKAIMDKLLAHKNIALAVVYGPANQLIEPPKGFDRVTPPGAKPSDEANKPEEDDLKVLTRFSEDYKKALDAAGLDSKRKARQSAGGSLSNWLYFHYGVQTLELDVWGVPGAKKTDAKPDAGKSDAAAPDQAKPENGGKKPEGGDKKKDGKGNDLLPWLDANNAAAVIPWTSVTLKDGRKAEVGGVDPFAEYAPPYALLKPALEVHRNQVLEWAGKLADIELLDIETKLMGDDVWQVRAVAGMKGLWPTHSKLAARMKNRIPVNLEISFGKSVTPITLARRVFVERLDSNSTLQGEWLVKGRKGEAVTLTVWTPHTGRAERSVRLGEGK